MISAAAGDKIPDAMRRRPARHLLLILGAFVALGISMSTVAANDMSISAIKTVAMMDGMTSVDCEDSGKGTPCQADTLSCGLICAGPALSLPPSAASFRDAARARDFIAHDARTLVGTGPPPELSPPRSTHLV